MIVRLKIKPQPYQADIVNDPTRFKIVNAGRRVGKTDLGMMWLLRHMLTEPNKIAWWASPTYALSQRGMRKLKRILPNSEYSENRTEKRFILRNGSEIWFKSCEDPDKSLLGEGLHYLVIDEAAMVAEGVWEQYLRPTLSDYRGQCLMISTPRPGWFADKYYMAEGGTDSDWKAWTFPSWANLIIFPEGENDPEILTAKKDTPKDIFDQEYGAKIIAAMDSVFKEVDNILVSSENDECPHDETIMGVDLARHVDYTVYTFICKHCKKVVKTVRYQGKEWDYVREDIYRKYVENKAIVLYIDATGIGDVVTGDLDKYNMRKENYVLTNKSKCDLIQNLMVGIETQDVLISRESDNCDILVTELKAYKYKYSPSGTLTYDAPHGSHDDTVIAMALAYWGIKQRKSSMIQIFDPDLITLEQGDDNEFY